MTRSLAGHLLNVHTCRPVFGRIRAGLTRPNVARTSGRISKKTKVFAIENFQGITDDSLTAPDPTMSLNRFSYSYLARTCTLSAAGGRFALSTWQTNR